MGSEQGESRLWEAAVKATTDLMKIYPFAEFFASAAANLAKLLSADGAALIVRDGPERLKYRLFYRLDHINLDAVTKFSFPANRGTVGRALSTGDYLFTRDYFNSEDAMSEFIDVGLRSNLVLPLPGPTGFIGAIAICWIHRQSGSLNPSSLAIAGMFASLIGAAVYREELQKQLEDNSLTDSLTGVPNRRMLLMHLEEAQKRACRNQSLMVLAILDLDGFKIVNDRFGHAVGDQKLQLVASVVHKTIRNVDMIGRFGGDEFLIILEDLRSLHEVTVILNRIVEAIDHQVNESHDCDKVTGSLGATIYPLDFSEPAMLLKHADDAMYYSKKNGGNQVHIYSENSYDRLLQVWHHSI